MILLVRSCLIFSSWPPNKHSLSLSLSFSLSFSSNKITVLVDKKKTKNCLMFGVCVQTVERLGSKIYCVIKKEKKVRGERNKSWVDCLRQTIQENPWQTTQPIGNGGEENKQSKNIQNIQKCIL